MPEEVFKMKISEMICKAAAAALITTLAACSSGEAVLNGADDGAVLTAKNMDDGMNSCAFNVPEDCDTLRVEYSVEKGNFDMRVVPFALGEDSEAEAEDLAGAAEAGDAVIDETAVEGEGVVEYKAEPGQYIVTFYEHNLTGTVTLKAVKGS